MHQEKSSIYSLDAINNGALLQKQLANPTLSVWTMACLPYMFQLSSIGGNLKQKFSEVSFSLSVNFPQEIKYFSSKPVPFELIWCTFLNTYSKVSHNLYVYSKLIRKVRKRRHRNTLFGHIGDQIS